MGVMKIVFVSLIIVFVAGSPIGHAKITAHETVTQLYKNKQYKKAQAFMRRQLNEGLLKRDSKTGANFCINFATISASFKDWQVLYHGLSPHFEACLKAVSAKAGDKLILLFSDAAGRIKKTSKQEQLIKRGIERLKKREGDHAKSTLIFQIDAAYSYLGAQQIATAEQQFITTLQAMEKYKKRALYFNSCGQGLTHFHNFGSHKVAQKLYNICVQSQLAKGDRSGGLGFLKFNFATVLAERRNFSRAIPLHYEALKQLANTFTLDSPYVVNAYDGLAQTLLSAGKFAASDSTMQIAIGIADRILKKNEDPTYWRILNNAAAAKRALQLPLQAFELDKIAYEKRYKKLGAYHPDTLISLVNLAHDYRGLKDWKNALWAWQQFAKTSAKASSSEEVKLWIKYIKLRLSGKKIKQLDALAEKILSLPLKSIELQIEYIDLIIEQLIASKKYRKAADYRYQLLEKSEQHFGSRHPLIHQIALSLIKDYQFFNKARSFELIKKLDTSLFNWTTQMSLSGSYDAALSARFMADDMLYLLANFALKDRQVASYFTATLSRWKNLKKPRDQKLREIAETTKNSKVRYALKSYLSHASVLRELVRTQLVNDDIVRFDQKLNLERSALNGLLKRQGLPTASALITPDFTEPSYSFDVSKNDAVIEFLFLRNWQNSVLKSKNTPDVELLMITHKSGADPKIEKLLTMKSFSEIKSKSNQLRTFIGAKLAKRIEKSVGDIQQLFIIPDFLFFQLSFAELTLGNKVRLGEKYNVHQLSNRQAYLFHNKDQHIDQGENIVAVGGVYYGKEGKNDKQYLPGSYQEIKNIEQLARLHKIGIEPISQDTATESAVRTKVRNATIVHLATHGFFNKNRSFHKNSSQGAGLFHSGFLLANGKVKTPGSQNTTDGVVYSAEILNWNLINSELVVISSCVSGVGELGFIDTVRGLPLALSHAGARRVIVSLRNIPDKATAAFMKQFYSYVIEKNMSYSEAFIKTKRDSWRGLIVKVNPNITSAFVMYAN